MNALNDRSSRSFVLISLAEFWELTWQAPRLRVLFSHPASSARIPLSSDALAFSVTVREGRVRLNELQRRRVRRDKLRVRARELIKWVEIRARYRRTRWILSNAPGRRWPVRNCPLWRGAVDWDRSVLTSPLRLYVCSMYQSRAPFIGAFYRKAFAGFTIHSSCRLEMLVATIR